MFLSLEALMFDCIGFILRVGDSLKLLSKAGER